MTAAEFSVLSKVLKSVVSELEWLLYELGTHVFQRGRLSPSHVGVGHDGAHFVDVGRFVIDKVCCTILVRLQLEVWLINVIVFCKCMQKFLRKSLLINLNCISKLIFHRAIHLHFELFFFRI